MATAADKPSRRISSIFSLGSNSSGKSGASSNTSTSLHPNEASRNASPAKLPQLSTEIRESASTPDLRSGDAPTSTSASPGRLTPTFRPISASEAGILLSPVDSMRQSPQRTGSPGSRSNSRPASGAGSRPSSPTKFFRPLTPTQETKLSKRRSWLPGRSRPESHDGGGTIPQAWLVEPGQKENIRYDLAPLANLRKVSFGRIECVGIKTNCHHNDRFLNYGMTMAILLFIYTIASIFQNPPSKSRRQPFRHQESFRRWLMAMYSDSLHKCHSNLDRILLRNGCSRWH